MSTRIHDPLESEVKDGQTVKGFWALMNLVGGVSGLASLVTVATLWGRMSNQIEVNSRRLDNIEQNGSPTLQASLKAATAEIDARKNADDILSKRFDDMRLDYGQRIQNITGLLEKETEQQTALISLIRAQQQLKP